MFDSNANKEHALVGLRLEMLAGQFICSIFFFFYSASILCSQTIEFSQIRCGTGSTASS